MLSRIAKNYVSYIHKDFSEYRSSYIPLERWISLPPVPSFRIKFGFIQRISPPEFRPPALSVKSLNSNLKSVVETAYCEKSGIRLFGGKPMSEETQEKKNKKINKMTVAEINSAIQTSKEKMNGNSSKYILHLNARLEELAAKGKK